MPTIPPLQGGGVLLSLLGRCRGLKQGGLGAEVQVGA